MGHTVSEAADAYHVLTTVPPRGAVPQLLVGMGFDGGDDDEAEEEKEDSSLHAAPVPNHQAPPWHQTARHHHGTKPPGTTTVPNRLAPPRLCAITVCQWGQQCRLEVEATASDAATTTEVL